MNKNSRINAKKFQEIAKTKFKNYIENNLINTKYDADKLRTERKK